MANISIEVTPELKTFPFKITPGGIQQVTAIPRARLSFQSFNEVITAKIATNTTSIFVTCTCPPNYAYTFEYCSLDATFISDPTDASHMDDTGTLQYFFGDGSGARFSEVFSLGVYNMALNAGSGRTWSVVNPYSNPIFNQEGSGPAITVLVNDNHVDATVVGRLNFMLTMLQFDLEQVFAFPLNFPLPVAIR